MLSSVELLPFAAVLRIEPLVMLSHRQPKGGWDPACTMPTIDAYLKILEASEGDVLNM